MIIDTYDEKKEGTTKVIFIVKNEVVSSIIVGNKATSVEKGYQFYVDNYVSEQIEKFDLIFENLEIKLKLKDGEFLFIPEESEEYLRKKEIERLKYELEKLQNEQENKDEFN